MFRKMTKRIVWVQHGIHMGHLAHKGAEPHFASPQGSKVWGRRLQGEATRVLGVGAGAQTLGQPAHLAHQGAAAHEGRG